MNIAGKIGDLKDRFPDLHVALSALGSKEASSLELEQNFLEEEPTRVDACMEKCKALTQTLTTLKKLAGVQEARTKNYESHSLRRMGPNYDDPQEMLKDVNKSIRDLMPVNHQKRAEILEKMEPRYAMRKYRNQNIGRGFISYFKNCPDWSQFLPIHSDLIRFVFFCLIVKEKHR